MRSGSLIGAAAVALLATAASRFPDLLRLDRDAVASGEVWRLWTGHLVHASRDHFVFDVGAACLLFVVLGRPLASALRPPGRPGSKVLRAPTAWTWAAP